ncbi:MAG: hypothetical protein JRH18_03170 [Deltaproteobacteria bacterium]|nr:hypothetical protein [Deltaproteobacteria bacterium]MBW1960644.1 hypothetical protein [Deltaproteobacteria bacterium]MBW2150650.1 hypothetical protein [Deltaproteobacteria bacterium]
MKKNKKKTSTPILPKVYEAPVWYVGLFYMLLAAWTAVCVILLGSKTLRFGWPLGQLLMIAFVLSYTWYFSLGISYKITLDGKGNIGLTSMRRKLSLKPNEIELVEGPRFSVIPYCFVRFRLKREKAYLFVRITDETFHRILYSIRRAKPEMKFKGLNMFH